MKNIFKKNHIIITALAIMIVIAGYISFTNKDTPNNVDVAATNQDSNDLAQTEGMDVVTNDTTTTDINDNTTTTTETTTTTTESTTDGTNANGTTTNSTTGTTNGTTGTANDNNTGTTNGETTGGTNAADTNNELGMNDISDEDILASAQDVADNGELDLKDGVPGEAVLASTALDSSFFITTKMEREQTRAKSRESLMEIVDSTDVTKEDKQKAIDTMIEMTQIADKEDATEMLLKAKGFDGSVVYIHGEKVNVVVNAETLSEQQLAIIEDTVAGQTEIPVKNIEIANVVISE